MTNLSNGWIKLHRKILEWGWYDDANTFRLFIHLLLKANHEPQKWRGMTVNGGELITGRKVLAEELRLGEQSIRTSLTRLKSTSEITIKTYNKYSLIKINNWSEYQQANQVANQQLTSNQPATNHKQECKNERNIYIPPYPPKGGVETKIKKPFIEGDRAFKTENGCWRVRTHDGRWVDYAGDVKKNLVWK